MTYVKITASSQLQKEIILLPAGINLKLVSKFNDRESVANVLKYLGKYVQLTQSLDYSA